MHCIHGIQRVQTLVRFLFCFVLLLKVRGSGGGGGGGGGEGGGAGCNRLATSIGELTLGPFPCQLSPGGDVSVSTILDGSRL